MVLEKIKVILAEQFDVEEDSLKNDTDLQDDLGADSLDVVDLLMSIEDEFEIASAATSTEEIWGGRGNPVYPPARKKLKEHGIDPGGKRARRTTRDDYKYYDYLIGMDYANVFNMKRIYGGDPDGKISLLLDYCGRSGQEVADPWYTDNFDETWDDVLQGCTALLQFLTKRH